MSPLRILAACRSPLSPHRRAAAVCEYASDAPACADDSAGTRRSIQFPRTGRPCSRTDARLLNGLTVDTQFNLGVEAKAMMVSLRTRRRYLPAYGRNNFELNSSIAIRDVYRLFLVFGGDEGLFELAPTPDDPLRLMRDDHFADEIIHLLVGTAVANRIHLEHI